MSYPELSLYKGECPFIHKVACNTSRIDAHNEDHEVAFVLARKDQGICSMKLCCGFLVVLELLLCW